MEMPLPGELEELRDELRDLPVLAGLMPSSWELRSAMEGVDIDDIMEKLATLLQEEVADDEGWVEIVKESSTKQADNAAPPSTPAKKKKRKRAKTKKKTSEVQQNNMFQLLA